MKLDPIRFKQTEFANTSWTVTVEAGTVLEDLLIPEFFANVAAHLRPYDRIIARVDTGEWYAELLVLSCGRTWVKTKVLAGISLTTTDVDMTQAEAAEGYSIVHRGPHLKFCVIRKSDKQSLRDEFDTKEMARAWLADHVKA